MDDIEVLFMLPILLALFALWVAVLVFICKIGLTIILWVWNLPL